jgi:hypothetical protein
MVEGGIMKINWKTCFKYFGWVMAFQSVLWFVFGIGIEAHPILWALLTFPFSQGLVAFYRNNFVKEVAQNILTPRELMEKRNFEKRIPAMYSWSQDDDNSVTVYDEKLNHNRNGHYLSCSCNKCFGTGEYSKYKYNKYHKGRV